MDAKEIAHEVIAAIDAGKGKIDILDADGLLLYSLLDTMQGSLEYFAKEKPGLVKAPDVS